ncbi:MAG TPA: 50S ribosomal protein L17 [Kofleriaceae bacterium]|nr:50S ribosomal protein L17 [Kofleriaceae bacterium]
MRHLKAGRKLGRTSDHRRAMYSNMVASLVTHGQIETTEAKAKELRSIADRTLHWGVGVHQLVARGTKKLSDAERAQVVHAKRMARRVLKNEDALDKMFAEVAPELASHPGGYTRVLKTRYRVGDAAPMALIALVSNGARKDAAARDESAPAKGRAKGDAPAKGEKADKKASTKASAKASADKGKAKAKAKGKSKADDE